MLRRPITKVVVPLDLLQVAEEPAPDMEPETPSDELDWCFDDPELTQQLRAVKSGRVMPIAVVLGGIATAIGAFVLLG